MSGSALLVLTGPARAFGEHSFESNTVIGGGDPFFNVWSGQSVAQSFVPSDTYILLNVTLRLKNSGSTTDALNVTIRSDAGNAPAASSLAWSNPISGGTIAAVNVPLTPTPLLSAGAVYWIVATKTGPQSDAYQWHHSGGDWYPPGKAMLETGTGWVDPLTPTDLYFVTYGRTRNANVTLQMTASPARALVKDSVSLALYFNNTGDGRATRVWVNATLPAGLTYVSDNANLIPSATPYPNYTFFNVGNGPASFSISARVDIGVSGGTVLVTVAALAFTNTTGVLGPPSTASVSIVVGVQGKELYLVPGTPAPPHRLTPARPTGGLPSQVAVNLKKGGASFDFELGSPLARPFRALNVTATLYLDSASHGAKDLILNLTLFDDDGVGLTAIAYAQQSVRTNNINDYEAFAYSFAPENRTVLQGHQILVRARNLGSSGDDALLAFNATTALSRLELDTTTYVDIEAVELRDAMGPTAVWSPRDALVVRATVADPFGSGEVAGAWLNLTDPAGTQVLTFAPMALLATDPSSPSAWKLFESAVFGPPLANGTYRVEVVAVEGNGAEDAVSQGARVEAPAFTVEVVPTQPSVLSGDRFFYQVWFNDTGSGPAGRVWINATLPSELTFVTSSAEANRTGPLSWAWPNIGTGPHLLLIEVSVRSGIPPAPFLRATVDLNCTDRKGYPGQHQTGSADIVLDGPVVTMTVTASTNAVHSNETFTMTIALANIGDAASTLWVNATLALGSSYVSDTSGSLGGTSTPSGSGVSVWLTNMPNGASWSFDITVRSGPGLIRGATLTSAVDLAYTNRRGAIMPTRDTTASVTVVEPQVTGPAILLGRSIAVPGDRVSAIVEFTNSGDEPAYNVWENLTSDPRLLFVSASAPVTVGPGSVEIWFSTAGIGVTRVFLNFSVAVVVSDGTVLSVGGRIDYDDVLRNPLPRVAFAPTSVTASAPQLNLAVSPADSTLEAGASIAYTLSFANAGTSAAGDLWVNVSLPIDLLYVSDTSNGQPSRVGANLSWHWRAVAPGLNSFQLVIVARTSAAGGSVTTFDTTLQYTDLNGNRRPDVISGLHLAFVAPKIVLTLTVSQEQVVTGETFFYTLRVRNTGMTMAQTLWLVDSVNPPLAVVSYTSNVPATGTSILNWTYRTLQPGEEEAIALHVRVVPGVSPGTVVGNAIETVFTNSEGDVIGYAQSPMLDVTVIEPPSPLPYVLAVLAAVFAPVAFVLYRRSRARIEQILLITKEGILIDHFSRSLVMDQDVDVLSAMLTAVQYFVKDAFRFGSNRTLREMKFGDYLVLIERGEFAFLVVVTGGGIPLGIGRKLRTVLSEVEATHGGVLKAWNGDMNLVMGIKDLVRARLLGERRNFPKKG